jgi:hypothetical protein
VCYHLHRAHVEVAGAAPSPVRVSLQYFHRHVKAGLLQLSDDECDLILPLITW